VQGSGFPQLHSSTLAGFIQPDETIVIEETIPFTCASLHQLLIALFQDRSRALNQRLHPASATMNGDNYSSRGTVNQSRPWTLD